MRLEYVKRREESFLNWRKYAELILKEVRKRLNDAKIVVFGSVVRADGPLLFMTGVLPLGLPLLF